MTPFHVRHVCTYLFCLNDRRELRYHFDHLSTLACLSHWLGSWEPSYTDPLRVLIEQSVPWVSLRKHVCPPFAFPFFFLFFFLRSHSEGTGVLLNEGKSLSASTLACKVTSNRVVFDTWKQVDWGYDNRRELIWRIYAILHWGLRFCDLIFSNVRTWKYRESYLVCYFRS